MGRYLENFSVEVAWEPVLLSPWVHSTVWLVIIKAVTIENCPLHLKLEMDFFPL